VDALSSVSIIIPCYNKRDYVAVAIESALAQTHPCEVIVVDDGSTDGSLDEIALFDGRVSWVTGPNRGGSAARNLGLEMARGEWIQFLDADDFLPAEKVAVQLDVLRNAPERTVAFCPWSYFHDDGKVDPPDVRRYWRSYSQGSDLLIDTWYNGGFFPPHAWLISRALIDRAGNWDERLTGDDDGEFFGRQLLAASALRFCEQTSVLYRDPPTGSVSRDKSLKSALSFWQAFDLVATKLLAGRKDRAARKACLARARKLAYAWRDMPEVVDLAGMWERDNHLFDFSPSLPISTRMLVAFLGVSRGLAVRQLLKG
jgi:glycosyltransferase involved in cell wall biosynthesis